MKQRERELAKPDVIDRVKSADPTLAKAIDRYTEESIKEIGRAKAQVLKAIKKLTNRLALASAIPLDPPVMTATLP